MRIALTGTSNAGKTTIFEELKNTEKLKGHIFHTSKAKSFLSKGHSLEDTKNYNKLFHIHHIRCAADERFVTDRCVLDTFYYAHRDFPTDIHYLDWITQTTKAVCDLYDLVLFIEHPEKEVSDTFWAGIEEVSYYTSIVKIPFSSVETRIKIIEAIL